MLRVFAPLASLVLCSCGHADFGDRDPEQPVATEQAIPIPSQQSRPASPPSSANEQLEPREGGTEVVAVDLDTDPASLPGCSPSPEGLEGPVGSFEVELQSTPEQTFVLSDPLKVFRLYDDKTDLSMRLVHPLYARSDGALTLKGLPYVRVGDGCMEVIERSVIHSGEYVFDITNDGCTYGSAGGDDYVAATVDRCTITVRTTLATSPEASIAAAHSSLYSLADRFMALVGKPVDEGFLALRSTGTEMGRVDVEVSPAVVLSGRTGIDVVTPFGVANVDFGYDDDPIIGAQRRVTIGPQTIRLTITDFGNTNTHCVPSCTNVLDVEVEAVSTGEQFPVLVSVYE